MNPRAPGRPATRGARDASVAGRRLIQAWRTSSRVTSYLVERLPAPLWTLRVPGSDRRTVGMLAAHIHNSRCAWIRALGGRHGVAAPPRVDGRRVGRRDLVRALARSSEAMVALIELGRARGGAVPRAAWQNFPTDLAHFLAYFTAHEGHHRGQLVLLARQLGHRLPAAVTAGIWHWTRRAKERRARPRAAAPRRA